MLNIAQQRTPSKIAYRLVVAYRLMTLITVSANQALRQTLFANGLDIAHRWAMRLLLCLSLVLAHLLIVSHVHAADSEHELANHDCATCIVAELLQPTSLNTAKIVLPAEQNRYVAQYIITPSLDLRLLPYQGRAPPQAIPVYIFN